jgi:hypothetical protein
MGENNIERDLIIQEFIQRYNQYRWEEETRSKFIHYYIIVFLAFYGLVGFLFNYPHILQKFPFHDCLDRQYALIFLLFSIIGTLWFLSIISLRQIQLLEGGTIKDIKKQSKKLLIDQLKYPIDRKLPWLKKKYIFIFSETPLVFAIFLLNQLTFILSGHFFQLAKVKLWKNPSLVVGIICLIVIFIWTCVCRPRLLKIKNLDYGKIL